MTFEHAYIFFFYSSGPLTLNLMEFPLSHGSCLQQFPGRHLEAGLATEIGRADWTKTIKKEKTPFRRRHWGSVVVPS